MLLTIKKFVEETIDVEFPVYKQYAGLNKILSPKSFICVEQDRGILEIKEDSELVVGSMLTQGRDIEPDVFNNAFQNALSKFNQLAFMDATTPATDDDIRAKLYDDQEERTLENVIE